MPLYREQGIVLRTYKLGETDRIVNLLTSGRGKVRAVAKGVRRPGSKFGGRLEPFSHVDLQLYEGRNLDIISAADLITPFHQVRADFALSACGSTMVEGADRIAQEDERAHGLFLLLLNGLRTLAGGPPQPSLVLDAYLIRLASEAGYHPSLGACARCGAPGHHLVFHIAIGGVLCPDCAPSGSQPLDPGIIELLGSLVRDPWDQLGPSLAAAPDANLLSRRTGALVSSYLTYHLGKPLKAWEAVRR